MDLKDTPEEAAFRHELRTWLGSGALPAWSAEDSRQTWGFGTAERVGALRALQARMAADRWIGVRWPVEYGGRGASFAQLACYYEELATVRFPKLPSTIGINTIGPTIIDLGTPEQKARYLPKILSGEEIWCQGFSEPNAGSDPAGVTTRAEPAGDGTFVVNGQKVWTSLAQLADRCMLLARSETGTADRHAGLTVLLVDMRTAGIEVRPLRHLTGDADFNEVFFSDVRVPAADVLGEVGAGWRVATTALGHERLNIGNSGQVVLENTLEALLALAREDGRGPSAWADPVLRDRIAGHAVRTRTLRSLNCRILTQLARPGAGVLSGSIAKLAWSDARQAMMETATEILGLGHQLSGGWAHDYLSSRADTIAGGTSQIQRNILAERVLGLPREPRATKSA